MFHLQITGPKNLLPEDFQFHHAASTDQADASLFINCSQPLNASSSPSLFLYSADHFNLTVETLRPVDTFASLPLTAEELTLHLHLLLKRHAQIRALEEQSLHDPLTNLLNRRGFDRHFLHHSSHSLRFKIPLALLMIDLDHFKQFNDEYGHPAGDALLCSVADALTKSTRLYERCARLGGDEFALLLTNTTPQQISPILSRLQKQTPHPLSIGVASYEHTHNTSLTAAELCEQLLNAADQALLRAKKSVDSSVHLISPYTKSDHDVNVQFVLSGSQE